MESATALRDEGAALFNAGNYQAALPKFEGSLKVLASLPTDEASNALRLSCYLNTASCCVKLGRFEDAVTASSSALDINKKSHKAYFRRGQARRALKQYSKARIDFVMAMELSDDPAIKEELDAMRAEQEQQSAEAPKAPSQSRVPAASTTPNAAPPAATSLSAEQQQLLVKAETGSKEMQFEVGENFDNGRNGFPKDPAKAYQWYSKAAALGHPTATRFCAWSLKTGTGTKQNVPAAVDLYKKCALEYSDGKAAACLGFCYDKGDGIAEDATQAVRWYKIAAEQNDPVAQVNLALCLEKGRGTPKDQVEALQWFKKAASLGNLNAYINVGLYHEKGEGGLPKNMPEAFSWYLKAAESGDPTGMAITGWCYERGEGTTVNSEAALHWYTSGAMRGNEHAKQGLTRMMKGGR
jgi:TPR repeat protein